MQSFVDTLLALLPLLVLLVGLGALKLPTHLAGLAALAVTAALAVSAFGMGALPAAQAGLEGAMLALFPIVWVVVSAVFVYNVAVSTGSMETIKRTLSSISPDRRVQALILAFGFGGFLEAVAGFGTAVAIPAGIMAAMGFHPLLAATACLIANTIPVAFGVLGIPVITLAQVTDLSLANLALYTALQLIPFIVALPLVLVAFVTGGVKHIRGVGLLCVASGAAFAAGQTLAAAAIGPELAAVVGSLASLAVIVLWTKLRPVKRPWLFPGETDAESTDTTAKIPLSASLRAWSPYLIILAIVLAVKFLPFLGFLNKPPFTVSAQFYFGPGGKPQSFALASSGGTALFAAAIASGFIQGATLLQIVKVLGKTLRQLWKTAVTILCVVMLAKLMGYSGMVGALASAVAWLSGPVYPLIAPLLGALGTFLTGSDTSSNVLFGGLQKNTAISLGMDPEWLATANASGATAGKMISPQSISIATSSTGLGGSESKILGKTLKYCVVYVVLIGVVVWAAGFLL
jgi:lactate permease